MPVVRTVDLRKISSKPQSDVFVLGDQSVLKLFNNKVPLDAIEREARLCAHLRARGLPVPQVDDCVVMADDGRHGLIMERIVGTPLSKLFGRRLIDVASLTRRMAAIHHLVHGVAAVEGLPSQRDRLRERIARAGRISMRERQQLLALLEVLPDANQLCHGNFQPSNVMLRAGCEPIILSWGDAANGSAACDVARTAIILAFSRPRRGGISGWIEAAYLALCARIYRSTCMKVQSLDASHMDAWMAINAAVRIDEGISKDQRERLTALVRHSLAKRRD